MTQTINTAQGIPCPNCNPDGSADDPNRRIRASMQDLLLRREASCPACGFVLTVDVEGSRRSLEALQRLDLAFEQVRQAAKPNL